MKITVSWQRVLLVTVAALSTTRAEGDEPFPPGEGLDATGNPTNRTGLSRGDEPFRLGEGLDATGNPTNRTELSRGDEPFRSGEGLDADGNPTNRTDLSRFQVAEDNIFRSIRSSNIERGVCEITESCRRAGGHCINNRNKCSGAVNKRTCIGRKCWCCMPDVEKGCSPTHSCCSSGGYCIKNDGDCRGGVLDPRGCKGNEGCKCCLPSVSTSTMTTETTSITSTTDYDGPWVYLGDDAFVPFNGTSNEMNWFEAQELCESYNLELYHPHDILRVAAYLQDNWDTRWYWLGAKGNGSDQYWFNNDPMSWADPWYRPETYYNNGTNDCLAFITWAGEPEKGTVLFAQTNSCTIRTDINPLCGYPWRS